MIDENNITYDSLVADGELTCYTSHISHFKELFSLMEVRTFLECGCGFSTKYFIENSEKVISIEFETEGMNLDWMRKCREMYKNETKWVGLDYIGSKEFSWACGYQCSNHTDPAKIDDTYIKEMKSFFDGLIGNNNIDVAFVDAGVYVRGDMVELFLQSNIPIVIAHDTACDDGSEVNLYGWYKIRSTGNYEKVYINHAMGTTFFIRKDFPQIIEGMKKHALTF